MAATETHLDMKILVDKEKNKVVFAEASCEFVDILFSFLTLPLGTIVRLIGKTQSEPSTLGCFSTLCQSVKSLDSALFCDEEFKDMLLYPRSSSEDHRRGLKINIDDTEAKYFLCSRSCCNTYPIRCECRSYMSICKNTVCPYCRLLPAMNKMVVLTGSGHSSKGKLIFTKPFSFIVTDNLQVTPVVPGAVTGLLSTLHINDMSKIEERTLKLGSNELLKLLKLILLSSSPLTDLFVSKENLHVAKKPSLHKKLCADPSTIDKKIQVKVVFKRSSKEFLFVEARRDFVEFLFSLLIIPLGEMLHIMDGQSCLGSIDGLYKTVTSLESQYFISEEQKNILLRPKLPPLFKPKNHLIPLESAPVSCVINGVSRKMPVDVRLDGAVGSGGVFKDEALFFVFDNLEVKPFSAVSSIAFYKQNNVLVSDLEERTLSIGMEEGISILRAALNSSSAISNGLLQNNLIFKEPKQEK